MSAGESPRWFDSITCMPAPRLRESIMDFDIASFGWGLLTGICLLPVAIGVTLYFTFKGGLFDP